MASARTEAIKNLAELNAAFDVLQCVVRDFGAYLISINDTWQQLELLRVAINGQVMSSLASAMATDAAELQATVPPERSVV
jgi:hypothetical protein